MVALATVALRLLAALTLRSLRRALLGTSLGKLDVIQALAALTVALLAALLTTARLAFALLATFTLAAFTLAAVTLAAFDLLARCTSRGLLGRGGVRARSCCLLGALGARRPLTARPFARGARSTVTCGGLSRRWLRCR